MIWRKVEIVLWIQKRCTIEKKIHTVSFDLISICTSVSGHFITRVSRQGLTLYPQLQLNVNPYLGTYKLDYSTFTSLSGPSVLSRILLNST